ncbi:GNAT family N-acetyltransferase [Croceicoccus marinus]|uniref:N-acetyltransferase n=1 Tax=Croceicoccus marinus TaxID=450378 RepID=A0A1Z1FB78_9SPHN|nr:GNAT family N-acetyltransferase [Croceicoccus marinus]ARU16051.1 N-acetyltransferase [Croceicoccus marinus]
MNLPPQLPCELAIITERLVLRPPRLGDFDEFYEAARSMPPIVRGSPPIDRGTAWAKFTRNCGLWALLGYGIFIVTDRRDGSYLGDTGLARFGRSIEAMNEAAEAAWVMLEKARRRGIAHEAAQAAHSWFFERFGPQRTICMIDPENAPSLSLAARLGYRPFGQGTHEGGDVILLERLT